MQTTVQSIHWVKLPLDDYASLWIKDVNLEAKTLTYKVLSPDGKQLEYHPDSSFSYQNNMVFLTSLGISLTEFTVVVRILCAEESRQITQLA